MFNIFKFNGWKIYKTDCQQKHNSTFYLLPYQKVKSEEFYPNPNEQDISYTNIIKS